jgi:8-oxo-dGTP pyrophosphatase MutT (NUDIX family)
MSVPTDPSTARPTHAGGVVFRRSAEGRVEVLLVTARRRRDQWVFPKGHIEHGESPEDAAVREVAEEAGVTADVLDAIRDTTRVVAGEPQLVRYFAMRARGERQADEDRDVLWLDPIEAGIQLTFGDMREVLREAVGRIELD